MSLEPKCTPLEYHRVAHQTLASKLRVWFGYATQVFLVYHGILLIGKLALNYLPLSSSLSISFGSTLTSPYPPYACRPPLPQSIDAISPTGPLFRAASLSLDSYLESRVSQDDIDSLTLAVVTPSGPIFQKGYGVLKANETDLSKRGFVDENTIYRIESITKMFDTLETVILRDRGVLNWDDPVTKFLPNFVYNPHSWPQHISHSTGSTLNAPNEPITIRQLASHMSGLGRQYPTTVIDWPPKHLCQRSKDLMSTTRMFMPGEDGPPTKEQVFETIAKLPLIAPSYSYPVYSNTGFDLLGWVNVAANAAAGNRSEQPTTFADLLRRDIFERIGMNSSSFTVSPDTAPRIAVAARDNEDTDLDFTDSFNPSGGQYSSLSDLSTFMQTLLDPHKENSVLSPYTVREWLRPLHAWSDDLTGVGAPWEIIKYIDSTGRRQSFYQKGGNLVSHHSQFSINPAASYGVIVLVAGRYKNTAQLVHEAIKRFQPAFDRLQENAAEKAFGGLWTSHDKGEDSQAVIRAEDGSLWIDKLVLKGTDVLAFVQDKKPGHSKSMTLWSTGPERPGEFRIAFGRPALNDDPFVGCESYWITIDGIHANSAPIDLVYFEMEKETGQRVLKVPSAGVSLKRVSRGR